MNGPWKVMLVCVAAASSLTAQDAIRPIEDLRMPLEHYNSGRVKVLLTAATAVVPPKGAIEGEKIRIEFYDTDGATNGSMTAEACRYDRAGGVVSSDSAVRFEKGSTIITGVGMRCDVTQQTVLVMSEVKVLMGENLKIIRKADSE